MQACVARAFAAEAVALAATSNEFKCCLPNAAGLKRCVQRIIDEMAISSRGVGFQVAKIIGGMQQPFVITDVVAILIDLGCSLHPSTHLTWRYIDASVAHRKMPGTHGPAELSQVLMVPQVDSCSTVAHKPDRDPDVMLRGTFLGMDHAELVTIAIAQHQKLKQLGTVCHARFKAVLRMQARIKQLKQQNEQMELELNKYTMVTTTLPYRQHEERVRFFLQKPAMYTLAMKMSHGYCGTMATLKILETPVSRQSGHACEILFQSNCWRTTQKWYTNHYRALLALLSLESTERLEESSEVLECTMSWELHMARGDVPCCQNNFVK